MAEGAALGNMVRGLGLVDVAGSTVKQPRTDGSTQVRILPRRATSLNRAMSRNASGIQGHARDPGSLCDQEATAQMGSEKGSRGEGGGLTPSRADGSGEAVPTVP